MLVGYNDDEANHTAHADFAAGTNANAARIVVGHDQVGAPAANAAVAACEAEGQQVIVCLWSTTVLTPAYYAGVCADAVAEWPGVLVESVNEPNFAPFGDWTPQEAAEVTAAAVAACPPDTIIGPAIASLPAYAESTYFAYMDQLYFWIQGLGGMDDLLGVGIHMYPVTMDPYAEVERAIARASIWGKPVYVTEIGFQYGFYNIYQPYIAAGTVNAWAADDRVGGVFFHRLAPQTPTPDPGETFQRYPVTTNSPLADALTGSFLAAQADPPEDPPPIDPPEPGDYPYGLYPSSSGLYPSESLYPSGLGGEPLIGTNQRIILRDLPRTRLHVEAIAPNGNRFRWGEDEPDPAKVPSGISFSTTVPGGFDSLDLTLPRKPEVSYDDLKQLTTLRVLGPGGQVASENRLEASPRVSGNEMAVSPSARGWQAHLQDDTSARMVYVDRDLENWEPRSGPRKASLYGGYFDVMQDFETNPDILTSLPEIRLTNNGRWVSGVHSEAWYDGGPGVTLSSIYVDYLGAGLSATYLGQIASYTDDAGAGELTSSDLVAGATPSGTTTYTPSTAQRYLALQLRLAGVANTTTDGDRYLRFRRITVWGNTGISKRGTAPDDGVYASDVIAHAVGTWAPRLNFTQGLSGTLTQTGFIIPQLAFREPTTVMDIISGANRYHLRDWAVWEDPSGRPARPTFYYTERGARGRSWRARIAPSKLSEAGPNIEKLFNGVIVTYQDVDGTTKTVGPTGASTDSTSAVLLDEDTTNPANELGIRRWAPIAMQGVGTLAGATEVGRRFLVESQQYNSSGQAQLVGYVEDSAGVVHPAWKVRAGDTIRFVDAADTSPRRIIRTTYSDDSRTCSVDLDAPPEGLNALLERLQVVITPLGL